MDQHKKIPMPSWPVIFGNVLVNLPSDRIGHCLCKLIRSVKK